MSSSAKSWAVIVAAGQGERFGRSPKQFALLAGRPMVLWALEPFRAHSGVVGSTLVVPAPTLEQPPEWLGQLRNEGVEVVAGGVERTDSVRFGLETVPTDIEFVAVHDGARPLVTPEAVSKVLAAAQPGQGAIAARPVTDSLKRADGEGRVASSVDRERLWRAETPQVFPLELLIDVHRRAQADRIHASDCAGLCQRYGVEITLVEVTTPNPKITRPEDLELAEAWVSQGGARRRA